VVNKTGGSLVAVGNTKFILPPAKGNTQSLSAYQGIFQDVLSKPVQQLYVKPVQPTLSVWGLPKLGAVRSKYR
jgi:hypothetical protein